MRLGAPPPFGTSDSVATSLINPPLPGGTKETVSCAQSGLGYSETSSSANCTRPSESEASLNVSARGSGFSHSISRSSRAAEERSVSDHFVTFGEN